MRYESMEQSSREDEGPPPFAAEQVAVQLRQLDSSDALAYRELRLGALRDHPEAFASSYDDELARQESETASRLARPDQVTIGAYADGRLVGVASLLRIGSVKEWHKARIVGMCVSPDARGRGIGRAVLDQVIEAAREWGVTELRLAVTVGNQAARNLYTAAGFTTYGIEPRSLRLDTRFYDVELMSLELY